MTLDLSTSIDAERRAYMLAADFEAEHDIEVGIVELSYGFELLYQVGTEVRRIGVVAR